MTRHLTPPLRSAVAALAVLAVATFTIASADRSPATAAETGTAIFAGGCFWCVESDFDHVDGVLETISGYIGGTLDNPTYQAVSREDTGHHEAVKITYDPEKVSYEKLLEVYWHSIDPTDGGGQFCDRGPSYTSAIFTLSPQQLKQAEASKAAVEKELGQPVATTIQAAPTFWPAEGYHQDYYKKNPLKYQYYRYGCGRNDTVERVWGDRAFKGLKEHS
ncbi:peptide-methionine (S)-S-oxide reductase MsrA [Mangrovicella endophytica]|uniref:peptide-methionine (S)-S-oxide reductase MsrA n=1 Tax=Mangrovicella endophytica TaxID=2066697 RepID=UPI000C9DC83E|nr:peptide-methionine (S)-S-oxide reductase MsrA [Mangrovicella endophytica]